KYAAQGKFVEGSMLPKIEAAIRFVESGENKKVIITNLEQVYEALIGNKGTHIHM
ncbi:carbamate kinase, partial [Staphylococcus aureus]|nr:carbamate kinase [Staphylococcus aureus]